MKKTLTLLLLSGFLLSNAQTKPRFGLKAGLNMSKLSVTGVNPSPDITYKPGFHIGGFLAAPIGAKMEFHPEILYSNQGYEFEASNGASRLKMTGNINYLAVPAMFFYYPTAKFDIEFGPQLSFLMSHKAKVSYSSFDPAEVSFSDVEVDLKDATQSIEVGMNIGVGYKINHNVSLSGRYNFGISTVNKKAESGPDQDEEDRNSVFQFSLNYLFN